MHLWLLSLPPTPPPLDPEFSPPPFHCISLQVRRAKLYYLRDRTGKAARLKELVVRKDKAAN